MHKKREALTSFTQLTVHVSFFRFCIRFCLQGFKFWLWFSRRSFRVRVYQASPVFSPRWPRVCLAHVFANRIIVLLNKQVKSDSANPGVLLVEDWPAAEKTGEVGEEKNRSLKTKA